MRARIVAGALAVGAILAACVGSDPVVGGDAGSPGDSDGGGTGLSDGGGANDGAVAPPDGASDSGSCACPAPAHATATCGDAGCAWTCNPGSVKFGEACGSFGGIYMHSPPAGCPGTCAAENPLATGCTCPSGTSATLVPIQGRCTVGGPSNHMAQLSVCMSATPGPDFGGAYFNTDLDENLCGSTPACRAGNPMNGGACACPGGFSALVIRSILRAECDPVIERGGFITLCGNWTAPIVSFGGAYQKDDNGDCAVKNPRTNQCTCPAKTTATRYPVMADHGAPRVPSGLFICTP